MVAAYLAYFAARLLGLDPFVALVPVAVVMAVFGLAVYQLTIRHALKAPELNQLILTFGLAIALSQTVNLLFTSQSWKLSLDYVSASATVGDISFGIFDFVYAAWPLCLPLDCDSSSRGRGWARRPLPWGRIPRGAAIVGIDVDGTYAFVFALAVGLDRRCGVDLPRQAGHFSLRGRTVHDEVLLPCGHGGGGQHRRASCTAASPSGSRRASSTASGATRAGRTSSSSRSSSCTILVRSITGEESVTRSRQARSFRAVVVAAAVLFPFVAGPYPLAVAQSVLIYMALAVSWDMLLRSGQISFGIAGFFGIGAYAAAISVLHGGSIAHPVHPPCRGLAPPWWRLFSGFVILRLRTVYFAITTLALAEIFRVIVHNGAISRADRKALSCRPWSSRATRGPSSGSLWPPSSLPAPCPRGSSVPACGLPSRRSATTS